MTTLSIVMRLIGVLLAIFGLYVLIAVLPARDAVKSESSQAFMAQAARLSLLSVYVSTRIPKWLAVFWILAGASLWTGAGYFFKDMVSAMKADLMDSKKTFLKTD